MLYPCIFIKVKAYKRVLMNFKVNSSYSIISVKILTLLSIGLVASMIANLAQIVPTVYFQYSFDSYQEFKTYIDGTNAPFYTACGFSFVAEVLNDVLQIT